MKRSYQLSSIKIALICLAIISSAIAKERPTPTPTPDPNEGDRGHGNTSEGYQALFSNTTGFNNTALGFQALYNNTTGYLNTATGMVALFSNTSGQLNTGTGVSALAANSEGSYNTATGYAGLAANTTGNFNVSTGFQTLKNNTSGSSNVGDGVQALYQNTTGSNNIGIGTNAGYYLTEGDNNIDIGNFGARFDTGTIRIGMSDLHTSTFIAGISGAVVSDGVNVVVGADGHLGTMVSSRDFKNEIRPMESTSESILRLHPVTFHYKREFDSHELPQFGLIAEDVDEVDPRLVTHDADGRPRGVRYEAVNAMLLNEFLKQHRRIEDQQRQIDALRAELKDRTARSHNADRHHRKTAIHESFNSELR